MTWESYCLGLLPEPPHAVSPNTFNEVLGTIYGSTPRFFDAGWVVDGIRNQGAAPTCGGFGMTQAIQSAARHRLVEQFPGTDKWREFTVPSALYLYVQSLCFAGRLGTDAGTTMYDGLMSTQQGGFAPEALIPYDPSRRFEKLWTDELEAAVMQKNMLFHWIQEPNPQIVKDMVQTALVAGKGIAGGFQVDDSCRRNQGEVWPGPTGPIIGGHCMCVLDYPDGQPRLVNSWGDQYGDKGYLHTTWDAVCTSKSLWIIDFVPDYSL